jgi:HEAT repeat protein
MGSSAKDAVLALVRVLHDPEANVSHAAAYALGQIGPAARGAVPALLAYAPNMGFFDSAYFAKAVLSPIGAAAVPALRTALDDPDVKIRVRAAQALGPIGPAAKEAVPGLIALLSEENEDPRGSAASALGGIGPAANEAIPALTAALHDKQGPVRYAAAEALGKLGAAAVPALIADTKNPQGYYVELLNAFARIGPDARAAIPVLVEIRKTEDEPFPSHALMALRRIAPELYGN